jgi:hypothetical protein
MQGVDCIDTRQLKRKLKMTLINEQERAALVNAGIRLMVAIAAHFERGADNGTPETGAATRGRKLKAVEAAAAQPDLSAQGPVTSTENKQAAAVIQPPPPVGPAYEDVKALVFKLAETKGRDVALATLGTFGVSKGTDLKPEQYADAVKALQTTLDKQDLA